MNDQLYQDMFKSLQSLNNDEGAIHTLLFTVFRIYNDEEIREFIDKINDGTINDFNSFEQDVLKVSRKKFEEERKEEIREGKKNYSRDSNKYLDFVLEEKVNRDLILNTLVMRLLDNKEDRLEFVNWLEKQEGRVTDDDALKMTYAIHINNSKHVQVVEDDYTKMVLNEFARIDTAKLFEKKEIIMFVSLLKTRWSKDYLLDMLRDSKPKTGDGYFRNLSMELLCVPDYAVYDEQKKHYEDDFKLQEESATVLQDLLKLVEKNIISEKEAYKFYRGLSPINRIKLKELLNTKKYETKDELYLDYIRITLELLNGRYELLRYIGLSESLNSSYDKRELARCIDDNITHVFEYGDICCSYSDFGNLSFVQQYQKNKDYTLEEKIDLTRVHMSGKQIWSFSIKLLPDQNGIGAVTKDEDTLPIIVHFVNDNYQQLETGKEVNAQVSAIGVSNYIMKDNNASYIFKEDFPKDGVMIPAHGSSKIYSNNKDLIYVRGIITEIYKKPIYIFGGYCENIIVEINTSYGLLEINFDPSRIRVNENDSDIIHVGDVIESIIYLSADLFTGSFEKEDRTYNPYFGE